jgi:hypothetical protein
VASESTDGRRHFSAGSLPGRAPRIASSFAFRGVVGVVGSPPPSCQHAPVATAVGQGPELQIRSETQKQERLWQRVSATGVGVVVGVVLALWSTAGAWGGRPPHGEDVMSYLVRADFALPHLVAHGRLDGWLPRFYLGYQEFLFNGPGVAWSMGAARG